MEKLTYKLQNFEGPMDLLLHLISKHKLNIHDIEIFTLVEQYTDYVRRMQENDIEIASEFVEMAARLVYIKTVSLLPVHEEAEKLKEELSGELIEYAKCKEIAQQLSTQTDGFDYFERKPMQLPSEKEYKRKHEANDLASYYLSALNRAKQLPPPVSAFAEIISKKVVSVSGKIIHIYRRLKRGARVKLHELYGESKSVSEMVATFLAVLELVRAGRMAVGSNGEDASFIEKGKKDD